MNIKLAFWNSVKVMKVRHVVLNAIISLLSIFALSFCGHTEQQGVEPTIVDTTQAQVGGEAYRVGEEAPKVEAQPATPLRPVKNTTPYLRHENDEDNLRSFDPASEDDMPDNGMRRYMENDDEEGWD